MPIKKVTFSMRQFGQLNQNRVYFNDHETGFTDEQLANHLNTHWVDNVKVMQHSNIQWFEIAVQGVGAGAQQAFRLAINKFGNQTPETQTIPFASWVILLSTGLAGRKFRGRIYVPGARQGDFQLGIITAGGVTLSNITLAALNDKFTISGPNSLVYVVIHGEQESHDTGVQNFQVRSTLGCQRRRNIGVGV